jgi:hypothetical protein
MPYFIAGGVALLIAVLSVRFVIGLGKLLDTESNLSKPL